MGFPNYKITSTNGMGYATGSAVCVDCDTTSVVSSIICVGDEISMPYSRMVLVLETEITML